MLNKFKDLLSGKAAQSAPGKHEPDALHVAAASLLIEAAMMDGHIDESERARIADLVNRHFGVPPEAVSQIIDEGERKAKDAVDLYSALNVVNQHFDDRERVLLIEMLWEVAYADGVLHDHEAALVRRVAGLLGVLDRDSGSARKRAIARLGIEDV